MNPIIREYTCYDSHEILPLYESVGWKAYTDMPDVLARAFSHSLLVLAAYSGDRLVGLIRTVGDGDTIVYIQDLLIHPDFQRKGIGSALLQSILERYSHVRQIYLTADNDPSLSAFYESQGLRPLSSLNCVAYSK